MIPRKNGKTGNYETVFELGYHGMIDLAYRGGVESRHTSRNSLIKLLEDMAAAVGRSIFIVVHT